MNVAVSTGVDRNLYTSLLIQRLCQIGHAPVCVLSVAPTDWRRRARGRLGALWRSARARARRSRGGQPDADQVLAAYAREHGLDATRADLPSLCAQRGIAYERAPRLAAPEAVSAIRRHEVDVLLNAGGGLFRKALLQAVRIGVLNPHMGRLPEYRGYNVMEWMVLAGEMPCSTLHFIDTGIDTGDILLHRPLRPEELAGAPDLQAVRDRMGPVHIELLVEGVRGLAAGTLTRRPQRPEEGRQYFHMHPELRRRAEARWRKGNLVAFRPEGR